MKNDPMNNRELTLDSILATTRAWLVVMELDNYLTVHPSIWNDDRLSVSWDDERGRCESELDFDLSKFVEAPEERTPTLGAAGYVMMIKALRALTLDKQSPPILVGVLEAMTDKLSGCAAGIASSAHIFESTFKSYSIKEKQ